VKTRCRGVKEFIKVIATLITLNSRSAAAPAKSSVQETLLVSDATFYWLAIIIIIMIRQLFIRRRNMSMKSLQGRRIPGSRDECRTAPDGRRLLAMIRFRSNSNNNNDDDDNDNSAMILRYPACRCNLAPSSAVDIFVRPGSSGYETNYDR